jgi:phage-related minor tail protein
MTEIETLDDQVLALEATLGGTAGVVASFDAELARMRDSLSFTGREVTSLSSGFSSGLRRAFDGLVVDGMRLSDALEGLGQRLLDTVYSVATRPVTNAVGGVLAEGLEGLFGAVSGFARGGAFAQGRVTAFARGGVVSGPVNFPMRGGMGLMGEAGPEAILPLSRGADGRLGVQASGGGRAVSVVMNVSTPDVAGFRRSQGQIAAQVSRQLSRGQRNG